MKADSFDGFMKTLMLMAFAATSMALPVLMLSPSSAESDGVAVVFAPWVEEGQAMRRISESGGAIVRTGALSFIAVAVAREPEFAARVRAAGAWLLLDPRLLEGCFTSPVSQEKNA
jgi:hypothetical protein